MDLLFEDLLIISESENNELKNKDDKGLSKQHKICKAYDQGFSVKYREV